jgi:hypothetical protein
MLVSMIQRCPLLAFHDTYLKTLDAGTGRFPASRIQKGLVLELGDRDLSEEGVGFGLPVFKLGLQPVFPGSWRMSAKEENGLCSIKADFEMNLRARMARSGKIINNGLFSLAWENFSKIHREYPQLRRWISISSRTLKEKLDLKEAFSEEPNLGFIRAFYLIRDSRIDVELWFPRVGGCTELIVLNEQGANWFDAYQDSDGLVLKGEKIGSWNQIEADYASFIDPADGLMFTLKKVEGATMFRGRELVNGSLAWSGLAYVLPPWTEKFAYSIELSST